MDPNYFVCTLGEATHVPGGRPYRDVNHLVDEQAKNNPDHPAIGFFKVPRTLNEACLEPRIMTFKEVYEGVLVTAELLSETLDVRAGETVGLLCASSPGFFFVWLACIRLGHAVLLIAPECSPSGVANLCRSCSVTCILADNKNRGLADDAVEQNIDGQKNTLRCKSLPFRSDDVLDVVKGTLGGSQPTTSTEPSDIAYLHHTSGTSSGMPKPIPQSHRGAVGVLPALKGEDKATFTTTPLYHGGPADIFRAWTSNAMVWLFPSKDMPITASNIIRCLECADSTPEEGRSPRVAYFSSVPYVLQMMASDDNGLKWLQGMDLVGVGGAALPQEVGDNLVEHNVNLVSRFGSAECGFLLSSHRNHDQDRSWQYLRLSKHSTQLVFEPREDGLSELVIKRDWPHMAKRNREDGSYATSDLFAPHPNIDNAWKYHSRADSQLTLITGKKFDPAPIEDTLSAATSSVADALVFGNGQPYPGVLLFRSEKAASMTDDDFLHEQVPIVERLNIESQAHCRILKHMMMPMAYEECPLEKSSKGTVLRSKAETRYASDIERAYANAESTSANDCADEDLPDALKEMIMTVLSAKLTLTPTTNLFSFGVDSVAGMQIRQKLRQFLPRDAPRLPINVVEDYGNVESLAKYIVRLRHGETAAKTTSNANEHEYMWRLVEKYSKFANALGTPSSMNGHGGTEDRKDTVVLTGATGALGAHVLDQLRSSPAVMRIYCLVRGADEHAATERVRKALQQRQLPPLDSSPGADKVIVLQAVLSDSKLGCGEAIYERLAREATVVMHLAWSVNFRMRLRSFENDSIAGVKNLIDLALASQRTPCPRFIFCSSVASVSNHSGPVPEKLLNDPSSASDTGYSQSKWVAEQICARASEHPRLGGRVGIYRVGQLSGDSNTGVWNTKEAWPLMLSTVKLTKSLPDLQGEVLDWLPVDVAATAMIDGGTRESESETLEVFHVMNNINSPTWQYLLVWLGKKASFEVVTPSHWIEQMETATENGTSHPALQLLDHWKEAYSGDSSTGSSVRSPTVFDMTGSKAALPALRSVVPVDEPYIEKLWAWIDRTM